jgi:hypothetical protein
VWSRADNICIQCFWFQQVMMITLESIRDWIERKSVKSLESLKCCLAEPASTQKVGVQSYCSCKQCMFKTSDANLTVRRVCNIIVDLEFRKSCFSQPYQQYKDGALTSPFRASTEPGLPAASHRTIPVPIDLEYQDVPSLQPWKTCPCHGYVVPMWLTD